MTPLHRTLLLSSLFVGLASSTAHGCGGEPSGPQLTVAASSSASTTTGMGGEGGGSGGAGGEAATTTTTTTTSGMGGQGGMGEEPVHGCTSTLAVDMTGQAVTINLPAGPFCVKMSQGQTLTFTLDQPTMHRYLGGTYDEVTMVKSPSGTSPIASCCDQSPYTCCPATGDPISMNVAGTYPWYDDKNPVAYRGVVYVE